MHITDVHTVGLGITFRAFDIDIDGTVITELAALQDSLSFHTAGIGRRGFSGHIDQDAACTCIDEQASNIAVHIPTVITPVPGIGAHTPDGKILIDIFDKYVDVDRATVLNPPSIFHSARGDTRDRHRVNRRTITRFHSHIDLNVATVDQVAVNVTSFHACHVQLGFVALAT